MTCLNSGKEPFTVPIYKGEKHTTVIFTVIPSTLTLSKYFYLPTDAQGNCFKKNIKIYIKTALTCFGLITIIKEHTT